MSSLIKKIDSNSGKIKGVHAKEDLDKLSSFAYSIVKQVELSYEYI